MASAEDEVFEFLKNYKIQNKGLTPSYDEIAAALGIGKSTVKYHLENIEKDGKIKIVAFRSIQIIGETYDILEEL